MTETTSTEPVTVMDAELDRLIIDATREYIAAQRARPRDEERIADAKAELDALIALRDELLAAGV